MILKFSLGAVSDGSNINSQCPASLNNIMTPVFGGYSTSNSLFYYSNCSINSFKSLLLTANGLISLFNIQNLNLKLKIF